MRRRHEMAIRNLYAVHPGRTEKALKWITQPINVTKRNMRTISITRKSNLQIPSVNVRIGSWWISI